MTGSSKLLIITKYLLLAFTEIISVRKVGVPQYRERKKRWRCHHSRWWQVPEFYIVTYFKDIFPANNVMSATACWHWGWAEGKWHCSLSGFLHVGAGQARATGNGERSRPEMDLFFLIDVLLSEPPASASRRPCLSGGSACERIFFHVRCVGERHRSGQGTSSLVPGTWVRPHVSAIHLYVRGPGAYLVRIPGRVRATRHLNRVGQFRHLACHWLDRRLLVEPVLGTTRPLGLVPDG
jgi:hypothetical protein